MIVDVCSRWRERCARYRPAGEVVDVSRYEVAPIARNRDAKPFVVRHHYSGSYCPARRRFGLYDRGGQLVGVAVYGGGTNEGAQLAPLGCPTEEGLILGRFVLLDCVPGNGETFFLARCHELLRRESFAGIVSFSDPHPRTDVAGRVVFAGHLGGIYKASSACYLGQRRTDTAFLLPDGRSSSPRALAKIRARERGWRYCVEDLVEAGAPAPSRTASAEDLRAWLVEVAPLVLRKERRPGCLKYAIPLHRSVMKALRGKGLPYPHIELPACAPVVARCA